MGEYYFSLKRYMQKDVIAPGELGKCEYLPQIKFPIYFI